MLGPLGFRIMFYIDVDIDFWSSWGRFGLRLGGHFRPFWRLDRPKLVPKPSSNRLNFENVIFHEILRFPMNFQLFGPEAELKRAEDRPKRAPRGS